MEFFDATPTKSRPIIVNLFPDNSEDKQLLCFKFSRQQGEPIVRTRSNDDLKV